MDNVWICLFSLDKVLFHNIRVGKLCLLTLNGRLFLGSPLLLVGFLRRYYIIDTNDHPSLLDGIYIVPVRTRFLLALAKSLRGIRPCLIVFLSLATAFAILSSSIGTPRNIQRIKRWFRRRFVGTSNGCWPTTCGSPSVNRKYLGRRRGLLGPQVRGQ